jgi:tRNA pseudouridine65 synthase
MPPIFPPGSSPSTTRLSGTDANPFDGIRPREATTSRIVDSGFRDAGSRRALEERDSPEIPILFRDEDLVVVHKPAGVLCHRGMGASAHEPFLLQMVRDLTGRWVYPPHRLDRPTCGLVVFTHSPETCRTMQDSWQTGIVKKSYRAIVRGWMPEPEGLRDEALDSPDNGALQDAVTRWRELERCTVDKPFGVHPSARFSLIDMEPLTGRWHQLRRHFSRMHHPLAGDTTHGDRHVNKFLENHFGWWRLMLWARELSFPHPVTGEFLTFRDDPGLGIDKFWHSLKSQANCLAAQEPCPPDIDG